MNAPNPRLWLVSLALISLAATSLRADDWPAWKGPQRDSVSREKGLLQEWPKEGPPLAWKVKGMGEGFSGPAIVGDRLYTMGHKDNKQWVIALDVSKEGAVVWEKDFGPVRHRGGNYPGARATPTVDGDRLYTLGIAGDLVCMEVKDGTIVWQKDIAKEFGGAAPQWGYAESPLIDGDLVVCTPGEEQNTMVALNKNTGEKVWGAAVGDRAGYASIMKIGIDGLDQYVNLTAKGLIAVDAKTGKFLWRYNAAASRLANCTTPIVFEDTVFAASGYGNGGGLVRLARTADGCEAKEVYFTRNMKNHHGGMILLDGALYGCNDPNQLTCLDYATGDVKWSDRSSGKCSIVYADGMLYCRSERGPISLVKAAPGGFELKGRFDQPDRSEARSWPHIVVANGMMYVRDQDVLLCYDVRAKE